MTASFLFQTDDALAAASPVQPVATTKFADYLAGTGLAACFEFWRARRVAGNIPLKSAIDPVDMPRYILPYLFIYEVIGDRFRCRLAGTEIGRAFQRDPTGFYLDELVTPRSAIATRTRLFAGVVSSAMPVVYGGRLAEGPKTWMAFRRLLLPVSTDGVGVNIVFGMVIFPQFDSRRSRQGPILHVPPDFEVWAAPDAF